LLLDRARSHLLHGHSAAALASIGEHARRFPRGALSEERDALRVEALVAAARYGEARASAARFHAAYPGSLLTPAVDSALRENP
jgi:outer membrane protein assembly factor BamD (BamD/ComL family)